MILSSDEKGMQQGIMETKSSLKQNFQWNLAKYCFQFGKFNFPAVASDLA